MGEPDTGTELGGRLATAPHATMTELGQDVDQAGAYGYQAGC
ncbi:MAG: hypothetical protein ABIN55_01175 [Aeromicrobium sp.]